MAQREPLVLERDGLVTTNLLVRRSTANHSGALLLHLGFDLGAFGVVRSIRPHAWRSLMDLFAHYTSP